MAEYIDRETVLKILEDHPAGTRRGCDMYSDDVRAITRKIELEPAADVAPVRRGHWKRDRENRPICSECADEPYRNGDYNPPNYCPNCGAKMEVEPHEQPESHY